MCRLASLPPQAIVDPVADDATQPRTEFVRFAQRPDVCPRSKESFLGHVFALAHVASGTISQGTDQGLIPLNNLPEGIPASIPAFSDQIGIIGFHCMHRFGYHHITIQGRAKGKEVTENLLSTSTKSKPTRWVRDRKMAGAPKSTSCPRSR